MNGRLHHQLSHRDNPLYAKDNTGVMPLGTLFALHRNTPRIIPRPVENLTKGLDLVSPSTANTLHTAMPSGSDGAILAAMDPNQLDSFSSLSERTTRGRPLLLPAGRKLRHLNGIVLRNLTTQKEPSRPRGKSTDDDSLEGAWKTSKKTLALHPELPQSAGGGGGEGESSAVGGAGLIHSKSSNDLPSGALERPKPRRRSTRGNPVGLENPVLRQKRLDIAAGRIADVFFSLHVPGLGGEPIYVSEVVHKSMNPNFQSFDLSDSGPNVSRLDAVIVKIWANTSDCFQLLVEMDIELASLHFIGKSLENFPYAFSSNCIIFSLSDGIYAITADLPVPLPKELRLGGHNVSSSVSSMTFSSDHIIPTSSYDAIMKLNNLEDCINDAQATTSKVSSQITSLLSRESVPLSLLKKTAAATERRNAVQKALAAEKKRLEAVIIKRDNLKKSLEARRESMVLGKEAQANGEKYLAEATVKLERCRNDLVETKRGLEGQKRRIIEDLQQIYPVEPVADQSLGFTIRGQYLPNSAHEDYDDETISAAFGYTAHMVYLMSFYLGTYLRYPVQPVGSSSFIRDPISVIAGARTFPLWMKGTVYFRFEYAIFLLNKDIEQLMSSQGLSIMDLRNTLPNLKYLLLYITSGNTPILERERPSSPFIKMLRRKPSERSPATSILNGRSVSPVSSLHTRRAMSLEIPKRDFVDISEIGNGKGKGEVVYTTSRLSNGVGK